MIQFIKKYSSIFTAALILMVGIPFIVQSQAVRGLAGLAVAQTLTPLKFNNVRDALAGSTLAAGVLASGVFAFDGLTMSRITGNIANGLDVDVTRVQGTVIVAGANTITDNFANPTDAVPAQSFGMLWDGVTWDRMASANVIVDGAAGGAMLMNTPRLFDETAADFNRMRDASGESADAGDGVGVAGVGIIGENFAGATGAWARVGVFNNDLTVTSKGPTQISGGLTTSRTVSAVDTAIVVTLTNALTNVRSIVHGIDAFCDAGTATITITDVGSATVVWETPPGFVGTGLFSKEWPTALTAPSLAGDITVTLSTCGVGNTGTLMVRGGRAIYG